jgi:histidine ammonia-lyase
MYAAQALEFRRPNTFSDIIEENFKIIRKKVPKLEHDRLLKEDIKNMIELVKTQAFNLR